MLDFFKELFGEFGRWLGGIFDGIRGSLDSIVSFFSDFWDNLIKLFVISDDFFENWFKKISDLFNSKINIDFDFLNSFIFSENQKEPAIIFDFNILNSDIKFDLSDYDILPKIREVTKPLSAGLFTFYAFFFIVNQVYFLIRNSKLVGD